MEKSLNVKLVSYSQNAQNMYMSLMEQVAYAARVSNPANQNNSETSEKLVRYLIRNQHWSPLEMVSVCLEIQTTRDIARQILRHRSFSFQEFSQRYARGDELGFETKEARLQDTKNRQNSVEVEDHLLQNDWYRAQQRVMYAARREYEWAIENGIAKEQARAVLPEGMTLSRMYMNGTLRSWVHYIQLRSANGTQKEHRQIALECADVIGEIFPMIKEFINV